MIAHSLYLMLSLLSFTDEPKSAALIQTLPADGTWATFNVLIKANGREILPTWSIRSVGQAFHGGKQCRLIELEQSSDSPEFPNTTWRLVVPEDQFGNEKHPLGKPAKVWRQMNKLDPEVIENMEVADVLFVTLLKGPIQNVKTEEAKEKVNWQQGDLECAVVSGSSLIELGNAKIEWQHRVFRHEKVPFGFAGARLELRAEAGGQKTEASIQMLLRDHGDKAQPKLPDLRP